MNGMTDSERIAELDYTIEHNILIPEIDVSPAIRAFAAEHFARKLESELARVCWAELIPAPRDLTMDRRCNKVFSMDTCIT